MPTIADKNHFTRRGIFLINLFPGGFRFSISIIYRIFMYIGVKAKTKIINFGLNLQKYTLISKQSQMNLTEILLFCSVINIGIALGAGLYEAKIVLPLWFNKSANGNYYVNFDNMRTIDSGRKFWGFVTTIPLTLLMITNLVFAFQSQPPLHDWWVAATLIILIERIGTFIFFIPAAIKLQKGESLMTEKIPRLITWWLRLNYVRNALTLAALLVFLKALLILQTI